MDRLFLDANILFSAAYRSGAGLLRLWKLEEVVLCSSRYALEEARINLAGDEQQARLEHLTEVVRLFEPAERELPPGISLPDKDAPIVLAAIAARSTHLLTGDIKHFGPFFGKKIEGIAVLLPAEYLRIRGRKP
jgi:predicted nucleic acid-binding protein